MQNTTQADQNINHTQQSTNLTLQSTALPVQNTNHTVQNTKLPLQNTNHRMQNNTNQVQNRNNIVHPPNKPLQKINQQMQNNTYQVQNTNNTVQNKTFSLQPQNKPPQKINQPVQNNNNAVQNTKFTAQTTNRALQKINQQVPNTTQPMLNTTNTEQNKKVTTQTIHKPVQKTNQPIQNSTHTVQNMKQPLQTTNKTQEKIYPPYRSVPRNAMPSGKLAKMLPLIQSTQVVQPHHQKNTYPTSYPIVNNYTLGDDKPDQSTELVSTDLTALYGVPNANYTSHNQNMVNETNTVPLPHKQTLQQQPMSMTLHTNPLAKVLQNGQTVKNTQKKPFTGTSLKTSVKTQQKAIKVPVRKANQKTLLYGKKQNVVSTQSQQIKTNLTQQPPMYGTSMTHTMQSTSSCKTNTAETIRGSITNGQTLPVQVHTSTAQNTSYMYSEPHRNPHIPTQHVVQEHVQQSHISPCAQQYYIPRPVEQPQTYCDNTVTQPPTHTIASIEATDTPVQNLQSQYEDISEPDASGADVYDEENGDDLFEEDGEFFGESIDAALATASQVIATFTQPSKNIFINNIYIYMLL